MSALVGYASSEDEESDVARHDRERAAVDDTRISPKDSKVVNGTHAPNALPTSLTLPGNASHSDNLRQPAPEHPLPDATNGDLMGPAGPPVEPDLGKDNQSAPLSPYSANRQAIRNMTVPTMPSLDIPPSPPGSPPPAMEKKFQHFIDLKKQGVHFNEKLAASPALKNPALFQKLMDHAGLGEQDQYSTTLSENLWNPNDFPSWAYKEELAKSQQEVAKRKEEERARTPRESIDFVPATRSGHSSRGATPSVNPGVKGLRGSAAERVMAGLDRSDTRSPKTSAGPTKRDYNGKAGDKFGSRSTARSRSPKRRKRSRSR